MTLTSCQTAQPLSLVPGSTLPTAQAVFTSRLVDPEELEAPASTQRISVADFVDQLDEIPLPVHVENLIQPKSLSELEEDLDDLLKIGEQETTVPPRYSIYCSRKSS